jgi:uncharacterized membrane protein
MSAERKPDAAMAAGSLEIAIAHVLQVGTYLSVGLIVLGSLLLVGGGISPVSGGPPLSLDRLWADLIAIRPAGFLWLGILGVLATPAVRVLRALLGFWRRDERSMAAVSLLVLMVIAFGVFVGVMAR